MEMTHVGLPAGFIILDIIYAILTLLTAMLFWLYHTAYIKMHRTRVIKSVCFLMFALMIESIYFFATSLALTFNSNLTDDLFTIPWLWAIPKVILLFALGYFMYTSLSPSDGKCKELEKASDLSTLKSLKHK